MTSVPDLRVHVRGPNETHFRGRCTELDSSDGDCVALVEFSPGHAPALRLGETAHLTFRGGGLVANIDTAGLTIQRADEQSRRTYSFKLSQVPKELLLVLVNRRLCPRVKPGHAQPVRIQLLDETGSVYYQTLVHDISATGLSIIAEPRLEELLFETQEVRLTLLLPQAKELIELTATIRSRRFCGPAVLYGLRFEQGEADAGAARERVAAYLASLTSSRRARA